MLTYIESLESPSRINDLSVARNLLLKIASKEAVDYIFSQIPPLAEKIKFFETSSIFNVENISEDELECFTNLKRLNDIRFLNKFFEAVNQKLAFNGVFIGCCEITSERKKRILKKYPLPVSYPYYALDFVLKRVMPKTRISKKLYFMLTQGNNRVISLPEILGRLISCGFTILEFREINNMLYFVAKKINTPSYDMEPSYGPLFKMRRVGQNGKTIFVYKFRTMHPYAEYLQEYVFKKNSLADGGKFKDDFRITSWGKVFRKLWIDELPMLINWAKRDLKMVGVRPLSSHYFNLYSEEIKEKRLKYKPGLIPPFYVDMPKTLNEIMNSELKYLEAYEKNPYKTDFIYFWKAVYNILIRRARSN